MFNVSKLESKMTHNFMSVKLRFLILPLSLLSLFFFYIIFIREGDSFNEKYLYLQKDLFFYLNNKLSQYASLQFNITQLGDALVSFSLLSVFIVYFPKFWEALLTSSILSLIVSATLKELFTVPRPATIFSHDSFIIIGRIHSGYASLPSGHSITTFVVITTLLFAFMSKKKNAKLFLGIFMLLLGLAIAFSRVAIGAHFPFDVIIGSTIGFIIAIVGILISNKIKWLAWFENKKYYPIFILLFALCTLIIFKKILDTNLLIFYISLTSLIITLYLLINSYVKKN